MPKTYIHAEELENGQYSCVLNCTLNEFIEIAADGLSQLVMMAAERHNADVSDVFKEMLAEIATRTVQKVNNPDGETSVAYLTTEEGEVH